MKRLTPLLCLVPLMLLDAAFTTAQSLYVPRNFKKALKNQTRTTSGIPGKNYWQNRANYTIAITAMPPERTITGSEQVVYTNNSPDTLKTVLIKLFLNIHRPGAARDGSASPDYLTAGVQVDSFALNGKSQKWDSRRRASTQTEVRLEEPLLPHSSLNLSFKWHYQISLESGREGMIDSSTYFLAYFYPRVAVYDDYEGWDNVPFTEGKEFYSDFNTYSVTARVPANYIVWGTGTLQKPETLLMPPYLARFTRSLTADTTIHIARLKELLANKVTRQNRVNIWQFKGTNLPDMALALSNHFDWDGSSVVVDNRTGRRASVQASYNDTAADYRRMVQYGRHSLSWLSNNWPGVPYPYEKTTVFQGFAGMEYPMMANDESYADTVFSRFVAEHEIAHTYMPFYMGINETRYGFMDEGWATTFEYLIGTADLGAAKSIEAFKEFRVRGWSEVASADVDLPIITPGSSMTGRGLGENEYGKAALGYLAMKDLLGDASFKKCLHAYMDRWNGKHPSPWDFFNTFSAVSGHDLNWFWNNWFFSNNYIDLGIGRVQSTASNTTVQVVNIGGMCAPFDLVVKYADGSTSTIHKSPALWQGHEKELEIKLPGTKKITSLFIDGGIYMDTDLSNNLFSQQ